jgi:hypothetical protein
VQLTSVNFNVTGIFERRITKDSVTDGVITIMYITPMGYNSSTIPAGEFDRFRLLCRHTHRVMQLIVGFLKDEEITYEVS